MQRVVVPELLDSDAGTPREIADSLADLRMINRWFGGVHAMAELIREVAAQRQLDSLSWLDVAGGSGDLVALTSDALRNSDIHVRGTLLDRSAAHLPEKLSCVCADALELPFAGNSFDVVGSSLFIHHLEPEEIVVAIEEALRVARHAVLINDLIRHPLHVALAYGGYAFYRSRLTRHDAVASVRRAYSLEEIAGILRRTSATSIEAKNFFLFRMGVIAWKRPRPATT